MESLRSNREHVLDHHIYSRDTDPPFAPTFVRLPGYPLFIAGVYALFGDGNNEALFLVQGVLDTLTCVLIAMLAWQWSPKEGRDRCAALGAFLLAAACRGISVKRHGFSPLTQIGKVIGPEEREDPIPGQPCEPFPTIA